MHWLLFITLIDCFIVDSYTDSVDDLTVSLGDGIVRGFYKDSYNGRKYIAFEGIPFAKPPIQDLRFEDPQPVEPWPGILEAKNLYTCLQVGMFFTTKETIGQEDCLYLNVYIPGDKIDSSKSLDVLFHIHGGAFMLGSPELLAMPSKIMDRDVVYVSVNYRLGPLGFYSPGDGRGNYGLKDQTAGLKWVQKNIEKFGGNKDSVTLCGVSAGGASVHLHYFSELSKGLFHRGFAQSGVALNPWSVITDRSENAKILADKVGCSGEDIKTVRRCLKERPSLQIMKSLKSMYKGEALPLVLFGPVLEEDASTSFLAKLPRSQLESKKVIDLPLLMSMTMDEGTTPASLMYSQIDEMNADWNKWAPLLFEYDHYDQKTKDAASSKIKEYYFKNQPLTKENYKILVKACSHRMFHLGGEDAARLQAKSTNSEVYFLLMNYAGKFSSFNASFDIDFGVGHGMDAKFYYDGVFVGPNALTEEEVRMKDKLLDMMVSFAKTGKPKIDNIDFQPVAKTGGDLKYLLVDGPDHIQMKSVDSLGPHEFWNSLGFNE